MSHTVASTPLVNDTCIVERVTITAFAGRSEIRTDIVHTAEETKDEFGQPVTIKARSFPARVAQPYAAGERLAQEARSRHPSAIVKLVFA